MKTQTILFSSLLLFISFFLINSTASGAERQYRTTPDGEGALTEQMIENCILLKKDIDTNLPLVNEAKAEYETLGAEAAEIAAFLDKIQKAKVLDPSDSQELAAYNNKTKLYNAKLVEQKKQLAIFKEKKAQYSQQVNTFSSQCRGQAYYEDDYNRMVNKLGSEM
jgi:hypothetical protein